jgi:hypothetical protein
VTADADIQSWTLLSANGQVMMQREEASQEAVIRMDEMPVGVYVLVIRTGKGNATQRVKVVR